VLLDKEGARLSLLEAGSLRPLGRWAAPRTVQGQPCFTPDGLVAFLPCAGGWILKLDLQRLALVAEVRAGTALRGLALSSDGRWLLAGVEPGALVLFDASLARVGGWPAASLDGRRRSEVAAVRDDAPRRSFVVAFDTLPELWELSYDPEAEPIFEGLVHDYRMGESLGRSGFLGVRRTPLEEPLVLLALASAGRLVLAARPAGGGAVDAIHLDVRRRIARVTLGSTPQPAASALFARGGRELLAAGGEAGLQIVDPAAATRVGDLPLGPVASVRTHRAAPQLWVALRAGADALVLVDKQTLEVSGQVALPGSLLGPPVFTPGGREVLLPVRAEGDALLVHEAQHARLLARLPTGPAPAPWALPEP